jgi:hypothetical protein
MNPYRTETTGVLREPASGTHTWPKLSRENGRNASKTVASLPGQRQNRLGGNLTAARCPGGCPRPALRVPSISERMKKRFNARASCKLACIETMPGSKYSRSSSPLAAPGPQFSCHQIIARREPVTGVGSSACAGYASISSRLTEENASALRSSNPSGRAIPTL